MDEKFLFKPYVIFSHFVIHVVRIYYVRMRIAIARMRIAILTILNGIEKLVHPHAYLTSNFGVFCFVSNAVGTIFCQ